MKMTHIPVYSWGRSRCETDVWSPETVADEIDWAGEKSFLAVGKLRSYGDCAFDTQGVLLAMRGLRKVIEFDAEKKFVTVEAGCTLGELLEFLVPKGFFLPVVPGTKDITVGGAIANDIHGKNHHCEGSFGHHVASLALLRSDNVVHRCSLGNNPELFCATVGGMGLTGVILTAMLRVVPIASTQLQVSTQRFGKLEDFEALCVASDANYTHTVAWIDALAPQGQLGRGIFMAGKWEKEKGPLQVHSRLALTIPPLPISPLVGPMLKAFNTLYYYKAPKMETKRVAHYNGFFFPLDALNDWSRLYGPRGLTQFQAVVPKANFGAIKEMLTVAKKAGGGSFLGVLKKFGDKPNVGMMSFPMSGYTLALDFANEGRKTKKMLADMARVTELAGGRFYAAKDNGYQSAEAFARGYPAREEFGKWVDAKISSDLWRRLSI